MSNPVKHNLRQESQGHGVPPKVRRVLQQAAAVGWHATPRNKRGFWAVAPDELTRAYVPITIKDEDRTAKTIDTILQKWKKAQLSEAEQAEASAPKGAFTLVPTCPDCKRTFKTWVAAQTCQAGHEADAPEVEETVEQGQDDNNLSTESGTISVPDIEESETVAEPTKTAPNAGIKHPVHRKWQQVDAGLARDLYDAMKSRSQGNMTPSSYANIIAKDIEEIWTARGHVSYQDPMTLLNMVQGLVSQVETAERADSEEVEALNLRVWELADQLANETKRADEAEATLRAAAELFTPKK